LAVQTNFPLEPAKICICSKVLHREALILRGNLRFGCGELIALLSADTGNFSFLEIETGDPAMLKKALLAALFFASGSALLHADTVPFDTWVETSFGEAKTPVDGSPFTFTITTDAILTITDEFLPRDQFGVYEGKQLVGKTDAVSEYSNDFCDDPAACLADPLFSHGEFTFTPGSYSLGIDVLKSPSDGGVFALRLDPILTTVPEPASLLLMGAGLLGAGLLVKSRVNS
jgi:hypothetical protein